MTAHPDPSHRHFANTRWSLVMHLDAPATGDARAALVELCLRYWYPVYAYVRRCGHAPPIAQDITRSFLQHLLQHFGDRDRLREQGQFRTYLLTRLNAFLADDWREAVDGEVIAELAVPPGDLEQRNRQDTIDSDSPEQAYQRSFALDVLMHSFKRLRDEAQQTGHVDMYDALEPFMAQDPAPGEFEEAALRLKSRPLALVVALKRLRQRFRELIGEELADTVGSAEELLAEQQALHAVLRGRT